MTQFSITIPQYYERLNEYFPEEEMKHPSQLHDLVTKEAHYQKLESADYLLLYADFPDFLFVDYLLVNSNTRGKGIGSKVLKQLQAKKRPILLEVEKPNDAEPDTILRRRFYKRHGFKLAKDVLYCREDKQGKPFTMDILYWAPVTRQIKDRHVFTMMSTVCRRIHNFNAKNYYKRLPADPEVVLSLRP